MSKNTIVHFYRAFCITIFTFVGRFLSLYSRRTTVSAITLEKFSIKGYVTIGVRYEFFNFIDTNRLSNYDLMGRILRPLNGFQIHAFLYQFPQRTHFTEAIDMSDTHFQCKVNFFLSGETTQSET